jgi:hypothetical protein
MEGIIHELAPGPARPSRAIARDQAGRVLRSALGLVKPDRFTLTYRDSATEITENTEGIKELGRYAGLTKSVSMKRNVHS